MSETSTRTGEDDPIADLRIGVLDRTVHGDTLSRRKISNVEKQTGRLLSLTAHKIDAASALSRPSGMGVTCRT